MDMYKLYKEQYDLEWSHRSYLLSMTNLCIVAVTVIGTAWVTAAQSFNYAPGYSTWFFVPLMLASVAVWVFALGNIRKAVIGQEYEYLPRYQRIEHRRARIEAWAKSPGVKANPDAVLEQEIQVATAKAASANFYINGERARYVQRALKGIVWSLMLLVIAAIPYLLGNTGGEQAIISFFTDNSQ